MLLVTWNTTGKVWLAQQLPNFKFNRLDSDGGRHMYGRHWLSHTRYVTGPKEWTQVGPLNMVQWSK